MFVNNISDEKEDFFYSTLNLVDKLNTRHERHNT